eukprot:8763197-Pyramimonas_sp.AAC.1
MGPAPRDNMSAREEEHGPLRSKNLPTTIKPSQAWIHTATRLRLRNSVLLSHAGGRPRPAGAPQARLKQIPTLRRPPSRICRWRRLLRRALM